MSFFLIAFPALFSIINPLGGSFIFLLATDQYTPAVRAQLARWVAIYSFAIVTGSVYIGAYVLGFFGISIPVLRVAGGIVIALAAWKMLNAPDDVAPLQERAAESAAAALVERETVRRIAFYPLAMPFTTGPGTIAVAISLGTSRPRDIGHLHFLAFVAEVAVTALSIAVLVYLLYRWSDRVARLLGRTGTNIIMRLSAFLLFCIGVQVLWSGVSELLTLQAQSIP
ncbi:MAG TPA: MarC family protein [Steroidobacteraceae bacterium]|nr:MarC family protein [Steroidobacteraceae bacterium]HQX47055.1 MarC family protein [Steroidobacteraceae bacterium]HQX77431.1 MarC family protein [Steroidobacteraceae bacterium]HQZ79371.1 MarC family protein [Steroidobacteraceae bacterium]